MVAAAASGKSGSRGSGIGAADRAAPDRRNEMRGHDKLARFGEAETTAKMLESALHGERCRCENDGGNGLEDELVQELGRHRWA